MAKNQFRESQSFEFPAKIPGPQFPGMATTFREKMGVRPLSGKNRLIDRESSRYFAVKT